MPNLNIFYLDEEDTTGDDPLQQGTLAAAIAHADTEEGARIHRQLQHLQADGDDNIPDASMMAFTAVYALIQRETDQLKKNAEKTNALRIKEPLEVLQEAYFMIDVVEICIVTCYYFLIVACFFLTLSLLAHT